MDISKAKEQMTASGIKVTAVYNPMLMAYEIIVEYKDKAARMTVDSQVLSEYSCPYVYVREVIDFGELLDI